MPKKHICICVCSFKRPQSLKRALECLRQLETENLFDYSIVVVDNDKELSAKEIVAGFAAKAAVKITYAVEPEQNISLARNKALQCAAGDYVAWIDDDEFPARDWLLHFFKAMEKSNADGALGPVEPFFENAPPSWVLRGRFFEKRRLIATGSPLRWDETSTANAIVRRAIFDGLHEPFRRQFSSGCEDVDFFKRMIENGHTFIWCNEAAVHELIPPVRWQRRYLVRRAWLRGQNNRHFANAGSVAKSVVALPVYLFLLPFLLAAGQHCFIRFLIKICDHAGKLLGITGLHARRDKYLAENLGNS